VIRCNILRDGDIRAHQLQNDPKIPSTWRLSASRYPISFHMEVRIPQDTLPHRVPYHDSSYYSTHLWKWTWLSGLVKIFKQVLGHISVNIWIWVSGVIFPESTCPAHSIGVLNRTRFLLLRPLNFDHFQRTLKRKLLYNSRPHSPHSQREPEPKAGGEEDNVVMR